MFYYLKNKNLRGSLIGTDLSLTLDQQSACTTEIYGSQREEKSKLKELFYLVISIHFT